MISKCGSLSINVIAQQLFDESSNDVGNHTFCTKVVIMYRYGTSNVYFERYGSLLNATHIIEHFLRDSVLSSQKLTDYLLKSKTKSRIGQLIYT